MQNMMALADDPDRLAQFAQKLQDVGKASGDDSLQQRKSLLELMHGLANYAAERKPDELDAVLDKMAGAAAQMSPDMLLTLITDPPPMPAGAGAPRMDLAGELQSRLTDEMVTKFLVDNIVKDRGASNRLATAFQTLVPDPSKQQDILAAAAEQAEGDVPRRSAIRKRLDELERDADVVLGREIRVRGLRARVDDGADAGDGRREDRRRPAGAHPRVARDDRATKKCARSISGCCSTC